MATVKCTINGQPVEVEAGSTIVEAFQKSQQDIAHYCWHPGLSIAGVCRMCMVQIEGNPRPQIACNTQVTEGMVVNNTAAAVKDAVKWTLEFHLINHPLDCPICDQAGECGLQEYYMKHGQYNPEMGERKVKKRKVVSLGEKVVLDTERCILCSRCVRFTDEVTKTHELGIFNRGDHSEVGTHSDRPLNNDYSVNVVDICPVGALTSKDFRFRQRVWFLKDVETVCNGCSTGCNVKVYYNENGTYRVKPVYNKDVNGFWMCDQGRDVYKFSNHEFRQVKGLQKSQGQVQEVSAGAAAQEAGKALQATIAKAGAKSVALVLTGQYTSEEYANIVRTFKKDLGVSAIYHWMNNPQNTEKFDGLLKRGDENPNTFGLLRTFQENQIQSSWADLEAKLSSGEIKTIVVAGPEIQTVYPDLEQKMALFKKAELSILLTSGRNPAFDGFSFVVPMKSFIEKDGTFENFKGLKQKIKRGPVIVSQALTLSEAAVLLSGQPLTLATSQVAIGV